MKLYTINAGFFKLDGGAMHGVVPKSLWQKVNPADDLNLCNWATRCLLIVVGNRKILIDTGLGNKQEEKFFSHYHLNGDDSLLGNLNKFGFEKEAITDVFLTHLHFDHCGGAIQKNEKGLLLPTFPNATYWSHEKHWNWAIQPNDREKASFLKDNILPIQESGQLKFINLNDGEEWLEGIKIKFVYGHTEAMMLPLIPFENSYLLYCADLIPSVAHLALPWVMAYDMRPLITLEEKNKILLEAVNQNWKLFFEHDPINECCSLMQTEKGVKLNEIFKL